MCTHIKSGTLRKCVRVLRAVQQEMCTYIKSGTAIKYVRVLRALHEDNVCAY